MATADRCSSNAARSYSRRCLGFKCRSNEDLRDSASRSWDVAPRVRQLGLGLERRRLAAGVEEHTTVDGEWKSAPVCCAVKQRFEPLVRDNCAKTNRGMAKAMHVIRGMREPMNSTALLPRRVLRRTAIFVTEFGFATAL